MLVVTYAGCYTYWLLHMQVAIDAERVGTLDGNRTNLLANSKTILKPRKINDYVTIYLKN